MKTRIVPFMLLAGTMPVTITLAEAQPEQSTFLSPGPVKSHAVGNLTDPVLVGAGDIASCDDLRGAEATAKLIDRIPGTVFAVGDLAYPDGSEHDFDACYGPTWGRFRRRTRPAPGNHEYHRGQATAYARYFGAAAGNPNE